MDLLDSNKLPRCTVFPVCMLGHSANHRGECPWNGQNDRFMSGLLHKFVQIALLRAVPQELPGFSMVLWIAIGSVFITSLAGLLFAYPFADALIRCLAAIAIPAAILYAALQMKRTPSRFTQCYAAICGASAVVYVLALPLMPTFFSASVNTLSGKLVVMIILLLDVWMLVITAHIFKHTFDVGMATGVSLALGLMVLTLLAIELVVPASSAQVGLQSAVIHNHDLVAAKL